MAKKNKPEGNTKPAAAADAPRKRRPVMETYLENAQKTQAFIGRLGISFRAWQAQLSTGGNEVMATKLGEVNGVVNECAPRILEIVEALRSLSAIDFQPESAPQAPKFAVGEIVKVDEEWVSKYTRSGLYKAEELGDLEISAIGDKEVIVKTKGGREVLIRSMSHLEATSLAEAQA